MRFARVLVIHSIHNRKNFSGAAQRAALSPLGFRGVLYREFRVGLQARALRIAAVNAGIPFDFAQGRLLHYANDDAVRFGRDDRCFVVVQTKRRFPVRLRSGQALRLRLRMTIDKGWSRRRAVERVRMMKTLARSK